MCWGYDVFMDEREARFYRFLLQAFGTFIGPGCAVVLGWAVFWCVVAIEAIAVVPLTIKCIRRDTSSGNRLWRSCRALLTAVTLIILTNLSVNTLALLAIFYFDPARDR